MDPSVKQLVHADVFDCRQLLQGLAHWSPGTRLVLTWSMLYRVVESVYDVSVIDSVLVDELGF